MLYFPSLLLYIEVELVVWEMSNYWGMAFNLHYKKEVLYV